MIHIAVVHEDGYGSSLERVSTKLGHNSNFAQLSLYHLNEIDLQCCTLGRLRMLQLCSYCEVLTSQDAK